MNGGVRHLDGQYPETALSHMTVSTLKTMLCFSKSLLSMCLKSRATATNPATSDDQHPATLYGNVALQNQNAAGSSPVSQQLGFQALCRP